MKAYRRQQPEQNWQARAIASAQQEQLQIVTGLATDLTTRLHLLIGRAIAQDAVYVDRDMRTATARVDGVLFQLHQHDLAIVRPCSICGYGSFASEPICHMADLGYALSAWRPVCRHCVPEDANSPDW